MNQRRRNTGLALSVLGLLGLGLLPARGATARPPASGDAPPPETTGIRGGAPAAAPSSGIFLGTLRFGGTVWAADSMRWEALPDSMWTFDTGVGSSFDPSVPGANPSKAPGLHTLMEGWLGLDLTHAARFRRLGTDDFTGTACVGSPAGLDGDYSFWCGLLADEADSLSWADGQGYGNDWSICIGKTFTTGGGDTVTLAYDYTNDSEPNFDYSRILVDTTGTGAAPDVQVVSYTGSIPATHAVHTLVPGVQMRSDPGEYRIEFCFSSDGAYSDEDGYYETGCGAFAVDDVAVTGGGASDTSGFETGPDGWSVLSSTQGAGDWSDLQDLDSLGGVPGSVSGCRLADSVLVLFDPGTGGHPPGQHNFALSPWIDLERAGAVGWPSRALEFDMFSDVSGYDPYLIVAYQYFPYQDPASGASVLSPIQELWYNFPDGPYCYAPAHVDLTARIPPEAEQVRVGLGVHAYDPPSPMTTPWFDNVRFLAQEWLTLQEALDAAADGDTVLVWAGTYRGPGNRDLDFKGKNVVLLAEAGSDLTVIDCEGAARGFVFHSGEDSTAVVRGFTIRNAVAPGASEGGGVYVDDGCYPTLQKCILEACTGYHGSAIHTEAAAGIRIVSCIIRNNVSPTGAVAIEANQLVMSDSHVEDNGAAGISFHDGIVEGSWIQRNGGTGVTISGDGTVAACTISGNGKGGVKGTRDKYGCTSSGRARDCTISGNSVDASLGGGGSGGCVSLERCLVSDNAAGFGGGVILMPPDTVADCTITGNTAADWGGGVGSYGPGTLTGCLITGNTAADWGGGVGSYALGILRGCRIAGNSADRGGGLGLLSTWYATMGLEGCEITGNTAREGGGVWMQNRDSTVALRGTTIGGNHAEERGGGLYVAAATPVSFERSILRDNCAGTGGSELFVAYEYGTVTFRCSAVDTTGKAGPGGVAYPGPIVAEDPLFCEPASCGEAPTADGDYHLAAGSPCLPTASPCDSLIGALGEGCTGVGVPGTPVPEVTHPLIAAYPNPFAGEVQVRIAFPGQAAPEVRVYDLAGRFVRALRVSGPVGAVAWDGRTSGGEPAPAGIYFIQAATPARTLSTRVVMLR